MTHALNASAAYRNAMEPLAIAEVQRQLQQLPPDVSRTVDVGEAIAYALNRLPPLYATTVEGWQWNQDRGRNSLQELIAMAASWGLHEAQRKRKPFSTPLTPLSTSDAALEELRQLLGQPDLDWDKAIATVAGYVRQGNGSAIAAAARSPESRAA